MPASPASSCARTTSTGRSGPERRCPVRPRTWRWSSAAAGCPGDGCTVSRTHDSRPPDPEELSMDTVTSPDGTTIAYDQQGEGPALILVDGALTTRASGSKPELAKLLAPHFTVYAYDRRGRGDSGDTLPYAVDREIEDIETLIDDSGGPTFLYGHSSGASLAMLAAIKLGGKVSRLAMYEAPYNDEPEAQQAWSQYISDLT